MSVSSLATIVVLNLLGALSPGPDTILITRLATKSRQHALAAVTGIQVGVFMWNTLTVLGAAALLTAFPQLLGLVQLLGGSWLLYMGFSTFKVGWLSRNAVPMSLAEQEAQLGRLRHSFRTGLATNLSNPKIVLFLSALIAPMLPASPSLGVAITLIFAMSLSCYAMFILISFVVSTKAVRRKLLAAGPWIDIAAGTFFMIAGIALAVTGFRDIFGI